MKPANKIIPRVHLPHLPSLTHLPTPLSKSFNCSRCHLESWDIAAATVLTGYQETVFTGVCEENWDSGDKMSCHGLYSARCWLWPGSSKALKHTVIPSKSRATFLLTVSQKIYSKELKKIPQMREGNLIQVLIPRHKKNGFMLFSNLFPFGFWWHLQHLNRWKGPRVKDGIKTLKDKDSEVVLSQEIQTSLYSSLIT